MTSEAIGGPRGTRGSVWLVLRALGTTALAAALIWCAVDAAPAAQVQAALSGAWSPTPLEFGLAAALAIFGGAPRTAVATAAGALYGAIVAVAVSQIAVLAASIAMFTIVRLSGASRVVNQVRSRSARADGWIGRFTHDDLRTLVLVRVFPIGNGTATTMLLAASAVKVRNFVLSTFLGTLPQTVLWAVAGHTLATRPELAWLAFAGAVLSTWLLARCWRRPAGTARRPAWRQ